MQGVRPDKLKHICERMPFSSALILEMPNQLGPKYIIGPTKESVSDISYRSTTLLKFKPWL